MVKIITPLSGEFIIALTRTTEPEGWLIEKKRRSTKFIGQGKKKAQLIVARQETYSTSLTERSNGFPLFDNGLTKHAIEIQLSEGR
jgi:hypothetical protein